VILAETAVLAGCLRCYSQSCLAAWDKMLHMPRHGCNAAMHVPQMSWSQCTFGDCTWFHHMT
jgi:hypothetical protein